MSNYDVLKIRDYRLFVTGRFASGFGNQMLTFALSWELWIRSHSPFALGMVGLCLVLPIILLAFPAGHAADNFSRRKIVMSVQAGLALTELGLAANALLGGPLFVYFGLLVLIGCARAFNEPAASTLLSTIIPAELYSRAATWNSTVFQTASIIGPLVSGLLIAAFKSTVPAFAIAALCAATNFAMIGLLRSRQATLQRKSLSLQSLREGIAFLAGKPVLLAAITLDLFAVLFGGAVALLPIYATDVLHVGASGLGFMRMATSVGALAMAVFIAHRPPFKAAGRTLLLCVAGFGLLTIGFGLSPFFPLSLLLLAGLGALDNVSVVIRGTLMLTQVPDDMRGRTSAVNSMFIASSNELGDFESGLVAGLIGPVLTVVAGGVGTLLVVLAVAKRWPQLSRLKEL